MGGDEGEETEVGRSSEQEQHSILLLLTAPVYRRNGFISRSSPIVVTGPCPE